MAGAPQISVRDLTLAYGSYVVMHDVSFDVGRGDVFVIMGGSGSGKSTLLRALIGLVAPAGGEVAFHGDRRFGVLFQGGALWSDLTLGENVAVALEEQTSLSPARIRELVALKLELVGLGGTQDLYPNQISGGMQKRVGVARAMALDPDILFLDEPSAGLDPITAARLDDLILQLREGLGTTMVVVSHDLASIFRIGTDAIYLDAETRTVTARGAPAELRDHPPNPQVHAFLTRSAGTEESS